MHIVETHYRDNFDSLVKKLNNRSGGHHNAEDVIQNAYLKAWQYRESFNPEVGSFDLWFNSILNNCLRDHYSEMKSRI